jgi:hypothetical protein
MGMDGAFPRVFELALTGDCHFSLLLWCSIAGSQCGLATRAPLTATGKLRSVREGEVTADLFAFLTYEPNFEVAALHSKAMPAILTTVEEFDL